MPSQAQARERLEKLIQDYNAIKVAERSEVVEADVIDHFVRPLLREVLGWPFDLAHFNNEQTISGGRVDMRLQADNGEIVYVEAKRFNLIEEYGKYKPERLRGQVLPAADRPKTAMNLLIQPNQMALPGMAIDRSKEEQQAINYAFQNGGTWAILTNFQKLRLFNAKRDWLVLSFEDPAAYLSNFDELWQLSYEQVMKGTLDALSKQRYREDIDSKYLEFISLWREKLANDILSRPEVNQWAFQDDGSLNLMLVRGVVQRVIDRLVVVRFAEDHLVIPAGTLHDFYELRRTNRYAPDMDFLLNQFFRGFDRDHNSALFAEDVVDKAKFSNSVLDELIRDLYEAKYRAMPADILGNTYEQYLGKALVLENGAITSRDNLETRKKQGSYYTPQVIVQYLVENSLGRYLYGTEDGKADGKLIEGEKRKTSREIKHLRVLDSACGSGSFLIQAYYVLEAFYKAEFNRLEEAIKRKADEMAAAAKDGIDIHIELAPLRAELERIRDYPNLILETHLYGTDLDPQAAELAVVNLMMRALEKQGAQKTLPLILNQNVKVGNALIGMRHDDARLLEQADALARLRALRLELVQTSNTDPRHDAVVAELETERAALYALFHDEFASKFSDLERVRPFHWGIEFPEAFYDENGKLLENAGFQVIIGNPPWEIVKPDLREFYAQFDADIESRLSRERAEKRIEELQAARPELVQQWDTLNQHVEAQSAYYGASRDYTRQGTGDRATHKLFTERMYGLLQKEGRLGYVVPSGIYTDLGTKPLREMLLNEGSIEYLYSFSNERFFFAGVDHRFKFCLVGAQKGKQTEGFWTAFRFNPRVAVAPKDLPEFLTNHDNLLFFTRTEVEKFSPDVLSIMEFQNKLDFQATKSIYGDVPLLGTKVANNWQLAFTRELDMTNDRGIFTDNPAGIRLYEGKMIHHFDAFFAEPTFWVTEEIGKNRLARSTGSDYLAYRLGVRAVASSTNERTLISTIVPRKVFCGNSVLVCKEDTLSNPVKLYATSVLSSLALDYVLKQKVTSNVNMFILYQLPVPRLNAGNPYFDALVPRAAQLTCTREEFADLWQEVMGGTWDTSCGATNIQQRQTLRDEIDAIVAHLYGLSRDEFAHILGSFALVFPNNANGQAKKAELLRVYDEWAEKTKDWARV